MINFPPNKREGTDLSGVFSSANWAGLAGLLGLAADLALIRLSLSREGPVKKGGELLASNRKRQTRLVWQQSWALRRLFLQFLRCSRGKGSRRGLNFLRL
jgi:hypothetical protein